MVGGGDIRRSCRWYQGPLLLLQNDQEEEEEEAATEAPSAAAAAVAAGEEQDDVRMYSSYSYSSCSCRTIIVISCRYNHTCWICCRTRILLMTLTSMMKKKTSRAAATTHPYDAFFSSLFFFVFDTDVVQRDVQRFQRCWQQTSST